MLTASKIRKDILNALSQHIIPQLEGQPVSQFLAEPPFEKNHIPFIVEQDKPIPDQKQSDLQLFCHWKNEQLTATRGIHIGILYHGCSEIRIGVTEQQCKATQERTGVAPPGIIRVQANAPFVECFPPNIAGGSFRISPELAKETVLHELNLFLEEAFSYVHTAERAEGKVTISSSLPIKDAHLFTLGKVYLEELQLQNARAAQHLLSVMATRLFRYLNKDAPMIQHIAPATSYIPNTNQCNARDIETVSQAIDFIQMDISRNLSCKILAQYVKVSPQHLNTLFKKVLDTTPAQYVHAIRMQTAASMLLVPTYAIYEIANLTGFTSAESFSTAFRKYSGFSPREFRSNHSPL